MADKRCIRRWYEEYRYTDAMVEEAVLHAGANKDAKYVNGILKAGTPRAGAPRPTRAAPASWRAATSVWTAPPPAATTSCAAP